MTNPMMVGGVEQDRDWLELRVYTARESFDAVSYALTEQGAEGVVEEEEGLTAYFPYVSVAEADDHVHRIQQLLNDLPSHGLDPGRAQVTTSVRSENSWAEAWKKYFKPLRIGTNVVIRPSWHEYFPRPEDVVIDLDPGMAFGTGTHATTRLCIELLEEADVSGKSVYDIGTGSGILAIVAARLGASRVVGVDTDPIAVDIAEANARRNKTDDVIQCFKGDWHALADHARADVVVANIIAEVIRDLAKDVKQFLKPGGLFIASGIIDTKENGVMDRLIDQRFRVVERRQQDEWVALSLTYDNPPGR